MFSDNIFILLGQSITESEVDCFKLVERVISMYKNVERETDSSSKVKLCIDVNKEYDEIQRTHFSGNDRISTAMKSFIDFFKRKAIANAGLNEKEKAELYIEPELRSYGFGHGDILFYCYLTNKGKGIAKNVSVFGVETAFLSVSECKFQLN